MSSSSSYLLRLVGNSFNPCSDLLLIPKVTALERGDGVGVRDGLEIVIELVDEGNSRRNVQSTDLLVGNVIQILHEGPQSVPVSRNNDLLSRLDVRSDLALPVRHETLAGGLQTLSELVVEFNPLVPRIVGGVMLTGSVDNRGRDVVRASPDKNLLLAVFVHCLLFVKALKRTVCGKEGMKRTCFK